MTSFSQALLKKLHSGQEKRVYTHYSFSCGFLKEGKTTFSAKSSHKETVFDLASLTKALVTSPLVLRHIQNKKLNRRSFLSGAFLLGDLNAKLDPSLLGLRVFDLLAHKSGLPAWFNFFVKDAKDSELSDEESLLRGLNFCVKKLSLSPRVLYSDVGFLLLGLCLERSYGKPLDVLFKTYQKNELGLSGRLFYPKKSSFSPLQAVPTSYCFLRQRVLRGEVHDENCAYLGETTGHAGLFGTIEGLVMFLKAFSKTPEFEQIIALTFDGHRFPEGFAWRSTRINGRRAVGHLGFTGCAFWVFPDDLSYLVLLTNRVVSGRLSPFFGSLRKEVLFLGRKILDEYTA